MKEMEECQWYAMFLWKALGGLTWRCRLVVKMFKSFSESKAMVSVEIWAIPALGSSSVSWDTFFQCPIFCLFILFTGFSRRECWRGWPFPSPVDHVWSELSTMTRLSWVAPHGMAHSFTESPRAVIHVIVLVSFLWLWFSFWRLWDRSSCFFYLSSDGRG